MTAKHTRPNPRFLVVFTEKQSAKVREMAKSKGITCSAVVRTAVNRYLVKAEETEIRDDK